MEYKLDNSIKILNNIYDSVTNLDSTVHTKKNHDSLFSEFATRGVLSSIKLVEKKLDRLLIANQNAVLKPKGTDEKPKFTLRCTTPRIVEELLNDISSKVDVIFDNISNNRDDIEDSDYENDYLDLREGSGDATNYKHQFKNKRLRKAIKKATQPCKLINQALEEILNRAIRIENTSLVILDKENMYFEKFTAKSNEISKCNILDHISRYYAEFTKNINPILDSYFNEQRAHFESISNKLSKKCNTFNQGPNINQITTSVPHISNGIHNLDSFTISESIFTDDIFEITPAASSLFDITNETETATEPSTLFRNFLDIDNTQPTWKPIINQNKSSCEDLDTNDDSGVYIFENNIEGKDTELFFNKRYCEIRNDGLWTVIQRRDNYTLQHNFNVSWEDYKYGFGNLHRDFWMGNDFLYKITNYCNLLLRIELEDFENNKVWAEYTTFIVSSENSNYQLTIGGYTGNASDSFSSHNGSLFSTYDKINDEAPEGYACFESNLNGVYSKKPNGNNYFRGIIWEHWLGNYSLKKSVMMVKLKRKIDSEGPVSHKTSNNETIPYYEDP
ncbi:hypothetical protein NQ314_000053 [Rhamnusium bicolor]|uniref:Fibrinogen C-terminal domain-containing protein n=1 Tax=Rhamnusium bicolor TaxID=1586634 RepID=A0AAV8ZXA9_9CUCU|nr:hypothetical protein NQ314_000053 [Rhamnusium bicolor]